MKIRAVSGIMLTLLLTSMSTLAFNIQRVASVDWWPMFHHDLSHTGYSTSPAPNTNNTIWTYTTGSIVLSSPAVADGKVYIGSDDLKVYCLNASTGTHIWNYTTGSPVSSSPAVADGKVYVGSDDNKTYCLNASTGAYIWSYTTGWNVRSSPAVADGKVYVGSFDGKVYAFGSPAPPIVSATVDVNPSVLNVRSKGEWITCYVELPEGYNPEEIDATTILLNETIQPILDPKYEFVTNSSEYLVDQNEDGILERMVKFDKAEVMALPSVGETTLTITGEVNGTPFEGSDSIRVIFPSTGCGCRGFKR